MMDQRDEYSDYAVTASSYRGAGHMTGYSSQYAGLRAGHHQSTVESSLVETQY